MFQEWFKDYERITKEGKCRYCQKDELEKQYKTMLYIPLPLEDDFSEKLFDANADDTPIQYIRRNDNKYYLITEIPEIGEVYRTEINYCPMCGRKLKGGD